MGVLKKTEPTNLQILALQFADKALNLVEANERLLDSKSGGIFGYGSANKDDNWKSSVQWAPTDPSHNNSGYQNYYNRTPGGANKVFYSVIGMDVNRQDRSLEEIEETKIQ